MGQLLHLSALDYGHVLEVGLLFVVLTVGETALFRLFDVELAPSAVAIGMTAPAYAGATFLGITPTNALLALAVCLVGFALHDDQNTRREQVS